MVHDDPLYVVTTVFNPLRFKSRYKLYRDFEKYVACSGAKLLTVEVAFGDRQFTVTEAGNPAHVQLRTRHELWLKENALNLGVNRLPEDWKYVAFVDADVTFARHDWVNETKEQLQHTPVVQMFSSAMDLGPDHVPFQQYKGFAYSYRQGLPRAANLKQEHEGYIPGYGYAANGAYWHPGYAWAYTHKAFDDLGGLIDFGVVGAADYHMACSLVGHCEWSLPGNIHEHYKRWVRTWQERADRYVMGHIGYVDTTLLHYWHGKKKDRKYQKRWDVLTQNGFDPELDLKRDRHGLWQVTDRVPAMRRAFQDYFRCRNEDSNEL